MSKKLEKDNNVINKIYLAVLIAVTVLFLVGLVLVIIDVTKPNDFSRIDTIEAEEIQQRMLKDKTVTFYVLVYNEENDENELISAGITAYDEYVAKTMKDADPENDAAPILKIEFSGKNKEVLKSLLPSGFDDVKDLPCLITFTDGKISNTKTTVSTILDTLQTASQEK